MKMLNCKTLYLNFLKSENITKEELSYQDFSSIIRLHNKEVMKQIILDNKSFQMGFNLGSFKAIERESKIKTSKNGQLYTSIDWSKSLEKKQELINKGEIPLEMFKDEKGIITGDNGGKEWITYNLSGKKPVFYWNRHKRQDPVKEKAYVLPMIPFYQLEIVPKNIKLLYSAMFTNNIRYDKVDL